MRTISMAVIAPDVVIAVVEGIQISLVDFLLSTAELRVSGGRGGNFAGRGGGKM